VKSSIIHPSIFTAKLLMSLLDTLLGLGPGREVWLNRLSGPRRRHRQCSA